MYFLDSQYSRNSEKKESERESADSLLPVYFPFIDFWPPLILVPGVDENQKGSSITSIIWGGPELKGRIV